MTIPNDDTAAGQRLEECWRHTPGPESWIAIGKMAMSWIQEGLQEALPRLRLPSESPLPGDCLAVVYKSGFVVLCQQWAVGQHLLSSDTEVFGWYLLHRGGPIPDLPQRAKLLGPPPAAWNFSGTTSAGMDWIMQAGKVLKDLAKGSDS